MYHIDESAVKATTRFYAEYMDQIAAQRYKDKAHPIDVLDLWCA